MKWKAVGHFGKRALAILLAVAFVFSGMNVTGWQVKAEETDIVLSVTKGSQQLTADDNNNAEVEIEKPTSYDTIQSLIDDGYTKLDIKYKISDSTKGGTGTPGMQPYYAYGSKWTYYTGGVWKNIADAKEGTITLPLSAGTGKSDELKRFGLQICNVSNVNIEIISAKLVKTGVTSTGDSTDFGTTRDYSTGVSVTLANQGTPSNDWSGFDMTITNNSGTTICDWIVKLTVPSGAASAFKCWNATFVADGDTIYMYPMQTGANAVLGTGVMKNDIPGGGFSSKYVDASNIKVEAVYYNKGASSEYDYSSGDTNDETGGTGNSGSGGSLTDTVTNKNLDIEYNYAKLLQESLYFYDANMCGELEGKCALDWRSNCHTQDKNVTYNGKTVDVSGGFHDAGDHVKFGLPQGYSATVLALSYYQFKDAYDELGQTDHYKTIMDYFCDYFKRCTVYNGDSVEAFCYQVGEGGPDHGYWGPPESQPQSTRGKAFFANASNPATDEVSVAIAALALHYKNFGNDEYLKVAKDLFAFADKYKGSCATEGAGGFYDSSDWKDDYCSAAAALYVATGDSSYKSVLNNYYTSGNIKTGWVLTWDNTWAVASVLQEDWSTVNTFASYGNTNTKQGFKLVDGWGSARYNTTLQFLGLIYDQGKGQFSTDKGSFASWATGQMNYLLGNNNNKRCFVVGYNENSSKYPHHRAASRSDGAGTTVDNHYTLLGALVGGPSDANDTYADSQADYNCNEVALDYNAGFVGAAAGLYLLHKNNSDIKTELAPEEELSAIGVTKYYGSSSADPGKVTGVKLDKTTLSLGKGESATLKATVSPATAEDSSVTWTSDKPAVATVDKDGKVTAVAAGTATITVKTTDGGKTATCTVTVTAPGITLNKDTLTLKAGASEILKATVTGVTDETVAWSSSDTKVATVDKNGKVTAVAAGTAKITATVGSGANAVEAACTITVTKNTPKVTVPDDITVEAGSKLSDIKLTKEFNFTADVEGTFAWKTTDKTLTIKDNNLKAVVTFTPKDEAAYSSVDKEISIFVTRKQYASVPDAPELSSATANTVTLKKVSQTTPVQYGIKQGTAYKWQEDNVFTGLSEYTTYEFALCYSETDIYEASKEGKALEVTTFFNDANKYKIDLAKLTEENYVEAHGGTITYDAKNKILTLTESKDVYIITGSNKDVEIRCADDVTVKLKGAGCKSVSGDGDLTVQLENKSVVTEGMKAEQSLTIKNGSTTGVGSLTVSSGENNAAITAPDVTIEGGQITATGTGEQKAIEATTDDGSGILKLFGGTVIANADSAPPIVADKIILDGGQVSSDSSPIYSTDPVDKNGDAVLLCSVTYVNGTESTKASVKKGSDITLPPLPAKAGYKANGWKLADEVSVPGETKTISEDVIFTADYTKITGTLEISVSDEEDLIAGYKADSGVTVTIANHTTVTIDEIALVLSNGKEFTISDDNITGLEPEDSVDVTVSLKNGFGVGSYETDLTVTCVEGEYDDITESITRVVGKASVQKPENAPEILSVTSNSVTLVPVTDKTVQYGIKQADGSYKWQASNKFTALKSYTTYSFAIRYAETASTNASEASDSVDATTLMDENGKYTVDLTKLDDKGYVDAHDGTISYDAAKKELTLLEEETYTITGNNSDIKIITKENATLNLENAKLEAIEADKDVDIVLKGTSTIKSTDDGQPAVKAEGSVTISQATGAVGSVAITGGDNAAGIEANEVTIKSGTVTVTGGKDAAGIVADKVTVSGGTVTITGQGDNPAVKATTTKFDVDVTLKNGSDYKEQGGDTPENPADKTTEKPADKTTEKPKDNSEDEDKDTGEKKDEKEDEDDGKKIKPALLCSNILLQKGKSIRLQTNDDDVEITKVAYANKKSKKIVKASSSGKLTGKKTGTASLKVTYEYDDVSYTKTVKVKVQKNQVVSLTKKSISLTLKRNKKANLVNPSNMLSSKGMKFSTSNKRYVKVSSSGVVKARRKGTAKVTVKIGKKTYTVKIKVK